MTLTRSDIRHLAELARLHVSDEEAARLSRDLTEIVEFIDRASNEDVSETAPSIRPVESEGSVRDDVAIPGEAGRSARQSADTEDGYVRVPPVRGPRRQSGADDAKSESSGGSNA